MTLTSQGGCLYETLKTQLSRSQDGRSEPLSTSGRDSRTRKQESQAMDTHYLTGSGGVCECPLSSTSTHHPRDGSVAEELKVMQGV